MAQVYKLFIHSSADGHCDVSFFSAILEIAVNIHAHLFAWMLSVSGPQAELGVPMGHMVTSIWGETINMSSKDGYSILHNYVD